MRARASLPCLLLALAATLPAHAAALRLEATATRAGDPDKSGAGNAVAQSLVLVPERAPRLLAWPGGELRYDLTLGTIGVDLPGGDSLEYLHFGPTWHYEPDVLWAGGYLELGTAVTRLDRDRLAGRDLGGRWHFTSHATLGHRFATLHRWHLALRLQHTSNAGIRDRNPGLNVRMLELGYHF